jgi:hypothetical protein
LAGAQRSSFHGADGLTRFLGPRPEQLNQSPCATPRAGSGRRGPSAGWAAKLAGRARLAATACARPGPGARGIETAERQHPMLFFAFGRGRPAGGGQAGQKIRARSPLRRRAQNAKQQLAEMSRGRMTALGRGRLACGIRRSRALHRPCVSHRTSAWRLLTTSRRRAVAASTSSPCRPPNPEHMLKVQELAAAPANQPLASPQESP